MTVARGLYLLFVLGALAVSASLLRTEQTRTAANIERLERERIALRRHLWTLETEIGQMRTPLRIDDRVAQWTLELQAPSPPGQALSPERRLVAR